MNKKWHYGQWKNKKKTKTKCTEKKEIPQHLLRNFLSGKKVKSDDTCNNQVILCKIYKISNSVTSTRRDLTFVCNVFLDVQNILIVLKLLISIQIIFSDNKLNGPNENVVRKFDTRSVTNWINLKINYDNDTKRQNLLPWLRKWLGGTRVQPHLH